MNERARETLAALADELIPAGAGMPSASQAGVQDAGLARVLAALPELAAPLARLLERYGDLPPDKVLQELHRDEEATRLLTFVVVCAYLTEPAVTAALGYDGRPARELADDLDEEVLGLLEPVFNRGSIYRPAK